MSAAKCKCAGDTPAATVRLDRAKDGSVRRGGPMADRSSKAQISAGEAAYSVNALRTTRSTLASLRDVSAFLSFPKN